MLNVHELGKLLSAEGEQIQEVSFRGLQKGDVIRAETHARIVYFFELESPREGIVAVYRVSPFPEHVIRECGFRGNFVIEKAVIGGEVAYGRGHTFSISRLMKLHTF